MVPDEGHDIWYELKSLTHELETWYKELFITICLHFKDCKYKEEEVKKLSYKKKGLCVPVPKKYMWTVKINWLMLYDWVDILGRNYCVVRTFFSWMSNFGNCFVVFEDVLNLRI